MDGTCRWLRNHEAYKGWLDRADVSRYHGLLLIKGKPGAGKSTVMKAAINYESLHPTTINTAVMAFFFNSNGKELEHTAEGFFRSISYQIFRADSCLRERLLTTFPDKVRLITEAYNRRLMGEGIVSNPPWTREDMKAFIKAAFAHATTLRVLLFVDGLDECDQTDAKEVAYFLRDLTIFANAAGNALDACISSRYFGSITLKECPEISVDLNNRDDISHYVEHQFSIAAVSEGPAWDMLKTDIVNKSSGVFVWVKLIVQLLLEDREQGANSQALRARLQEVPEELEDMFTELLTHHSSGSAQLRTTMLHLFQWGILSLEPLRLREWHHILAFIRPAVPRSLKDWRYSEFYTEDDEQLERQIRYISKGLLEVKVSELPDYNALGATRPEIDSIRAGAGSLDIDYGETRVVQAIHPSVNDFFLKNGFSIMGSSIAEGHQTIIHTCLRYISITELDELVIARTRMTELTLSRQVAAFPREGEQYSRQLKTRGSVASFSLAPLEKPITAQKVPDDVTTESRLWQSLRQPKRSGSVASFSSAGSSGNLSLHKTTTAQKELADTAESKLGYFTRITALDETAVEKYRTAAVTRFVGTSGPFNVAPAGWLTQVPTISSSNTNRGMLEADMPLLLYAINMLFEHISLGEQHGADPSTVINILDGPDAKIWGRWLHLNEDFDSSIELINFCVVQDLPSLVDFLMRRCEVEKYYDLFTIAATWQKQKVTRMMVCREMKQAANQGQQPPILRQILHQRQFSFLDEYGKCAAEVLAEGVIQKSDWISCLSADDGPSLHSISYADEAFSIRHHFQKLGIAPEKRGRHREMFLYRSTNYIEPQFLDYSYKWTATFSMLGKLIRRSNAAYTLAQLLVTDLEISNCPSSSLAEHTNAILEDTITRSEQALVLFVRALTILTTTTKAATKWLIESPRFKSANHMVSAKEQCHAKCKEIMERINSVTKILDDSRNKLSKDHPGLPHSYNTGSVGTTIHVRTDMRLTPGISAAKLLYEFAVDLAIAAAMDEAYSRNSRICVRSYQSVITMLETVLYSDEEIPELQDGEFHEKFSPDLDDEDQQFVTTRKFFLVFL